MKIVLRHPKKLILFIAVLGGSLLWLKWFWLDKPPLADLTKERIAFVVKTAFPDLSAFITYRRLYLVNLNGSGETNLGGFQKRTPTWSKKGNEMVYIEDGNLYLVENNDVGSPQLLLSGSFSHPTWSPNGTKIAFIHTHYYPVTVLDTIVHSHTKTLDIFDRTSGQVTQVLNNATSVYYLDWSPDGQKIAFHWFRDDEEKEYMADIATINIDGSGFTQLTTDGLSRFPKWSPDGNEILYQYRTDIYLMSADGTNQRALTNDGKSYEPTWSPDGRHILYISQVNEECGPNDDEYYGFCTNELRIMDEDGSNVRLFRKGENQRFLYFTWLPSLR